MAGGITNEILPAISNKENSADWRALPLGEDRGVVALTPPKNLPLRQIRFQLEVYTFLY